MATGVCSMIGASIYVIPFMIQRNVPGIGPYVLPAFLLASIPAIFAAISYAALSTAMPRAGGSYLYASRSLNPYLGFIASFSQWFGLSIVIGVISYVVIPFFRDFFFALGWENLAQTLEIGGVRVTLALLILWAFAAVNMLGINFYQRTLIPLMILMFGLGGLVIISGFSFNHADFNQAISNFQIPIVFETSGTFNIWTFLAASALLFSSFIGFDAIAQAGGEAKNPTKNLPRAIWLAIIVVGTFYFVFTLAVYHAVPWEFVASEAQNKDLTAASLLSYLLPNWLSAVILFGAGIALLNDLPAMILSVSRLVFSWSEDGIFPEFISRINPKTKAPVRAIILSTSVSTIGILGSHFAGDFFLGIDIMVTAMLVNFLFMCLSLLFLPKTNPELAEKQTIIKGKSARALVGSIGSLFLICFLLIHTFKDLSSETTHWYFHSTYVYGIVISLASLTFYFRWRNLKKNDLDLRNKFKTLPEH